MSSVADIAMREGKERSGADIAMGEGYREGKAERFLVRHGEETLIDLPIVALQQAWKGDQS